MRRPETHANLRNLDEVFQSVLSETMPGAKRQDFTEKMNGWLMDISSNTLVEKNRTKFIKVMQAMQKALKDRSDTGAGHTRKHVGDSDQ